MVMSVYNGEKYVAEAIESILGQTFSDFEFTIIDDGSSDNTLGIIQDYASRDGRIQLIENEKNIGLALSLNKGIEVSRGNYIARMDADDISLPDRFANQVDFLESHPEIWILGCNVQHIDDKGGVLYDEYFTSDPGVLRWNMMLGAMGIACHSACMIRKELFYEVGFYKDVPTSQDHELFCRLFFMDDLPIRNLPVVLGCVREHKGRLSSGNHDLQFDTSNEIRVRLMNQFMGKNLPKEVSAAYREIRRQKYTLNELNFFLHTWLAIYEKFVRTFKISETGRKIIRQQLLSRFGSYLSINPLQAILNKRPSLWRELITNRYLSFQDYGYLFSVNRRLNILTSSFSSAPGER